MTKILVWFFSMALVSLFLICDCVQAQDMPTQGGVSSYQGGDSQAKQPQSSSQKRVNRGASENRAQRIPKPERNRLAEGKSKKTRRRSRKRKKSSRSTNSHKHKANRKTTPLLVEDTHKASNKNNEPLKEENIKAKLIDDVANPYKSDEKDLLNYDHLSIESTWSAEEFDGIGFGDKRLDRRFMRVAMEFSAQPQVPINQACEDWADTKATYGLFHNAKVTPELILAPHQQRTQERMQSHVLVLAVQDTTYFNYTKHQKTRGLGPIGTDEQELRGLVNHTTLAITPQGLPLGVLAQKMWARDDEDQMSEKKRKNRAIEEKESYKWIESLRQVRRLTPWIFDIAHSQDEWIKAKVPLRQL
jgi:hypothetical protein